MTDIYNHGLEAVTKNGYDYSSPWKSKNPYHTPKNDTYKAKKKFCTGNATGNGTANATAPAAGAAPADGAAPAAPAEGAAPAAPAAAGAAAPAAGGNATANATNGTGAADEADCIPVPSGNATNASNATAGATPADAAPAETAALIAKKATFKSNITVKELPKNVPVAISK